MKRLLLSLIFMVICCAPALATQITVSSFQPSYEWRYGGTTATIRVYVSSSFVSSEGISVVASPVGGSNFYKTINCTISGTTLTVGSFTLYSTTDATPTTARYTLIFFDNKGTKRDVLWSNYQVPVSLGTTITNSQLEIYNRTAPAPPRPGFPTTDQVQQLINAVLPAPKSSTTINGIGKVSVNPADATNPIFVGDNDPRIKPSFNIVKYGALGDGSNDGPAINLAIAAACAAGGEVFVPDGRFLSSIALPISSCSNVTFRGNGYSSQIFFQNASGIATGIPITSSTNIGFSNLRIYGSSTTATLARTIYVANSTGIRFDHVWQSGSIKDPTGLGGGPLCGIGFASSSDGWVTDSHLTGNGFASGSDVFNTAVDLLYWAGVGERIHFQRNDIKSSSTAFSIEINDATDIDIFDNTVDQNNKLGTTHSASGYGIVVYASGSPGTAYKGQISRNKVKNTAGIGIYNQGYDQLSVIDNNLETVAQQQDVSTLNVAGISLNGTAHGIVSKNIIKNSRQVCIWLSGVTYTPVESNTCRVPVGSGLRLTSVSYSPITHNEIDHAGDVGIYAAPGGTGVISCPITENPIISAGSSAISLDNVQNGTVSLNPISSPVNQGVAITNASSINVSIIGNPITGIAANKEGIIVYGSRHTVSGNTLSAASATGTYGIDLSNGATDTTVSLNLVTGFGNGIYGTSGVRDDILNNFLAGNTTPLTVSATTTHSGNHFTAGMSEGTGLLSGGSATVNSTEFKTGDVVELSSMAAGGTRGVLTYTISDGVSMTVTSSSGADTSTFQWRIRH